MLAPKKFKHRKTFRGTWRRIAIKGHEVNFGRFGLQSLEPEWISDRQIEACRVVLSRETRKIGRYWIRIFPHKPYSKKPLEVGMGSGKGDIDHYVSSVVPGTMLFELDGVEKMEAKRIFKKITSKLPINTKFVDREDD
jgi:large subunit ribosomal protein L16